jgi:nucleotide-binding universal stress UspA family protein
MKRALFAAAALCAALAASHAEQFDPQRYFEERARQALLKKAANPAPAAKPLSGGSAAIGASRIGVWLAVGAGLLVAALGVVFWLRFPSLTLEPRVDDQIDREFRAMLDETGEEPEALEDARLPAHRGGVREEDVIEDLTGEADGGGDGPAGGKAT